MSKPATIAQSGTVVLPTITRRPAPVARSIYHRLAVGDALCVMSWGRKSYDKVTVTEVLDTMVRVTEEGGEARTMPATALMFLAGQAHAHFGSGPETPGVGYIVTADGEAHGLTASGLCVVCYHRH